MSQPLKSARAGKFIGLLFALIGAAFLGVGVWLGVRTQDFLATAVTTQGEVVHVERIRSSDPDSGDTFKPTFAFQDQAGAPRNVTPSMSSSEWNFAIGEPVEIVYDPAEPQNAKLKSFGGLWLLPTIFAGMGLVFTVVGVPIFLATRKRRSKTYTPQTLDDPGLQL
ncbi:MAG: DUF3592 domain-containing protein [Planctomycetota bacterium]